MNNLRTITNQTQPTPITGTFVTSKGPKWSILGVALLAACSVKPSDQTSGSEIRNTAGHEVIFDFEDNAEGWTAFGNGDPLVFHAESEHAYAGQRALRYQNHLFKRFGGVLHSRELDLSGYNKIRYSAKSIHGEGFVAIELVDKDGDVWTQSPRSRMTNTYATVEVDLGRSGFELTNRVPGQGNFELDLGEITQINFVFSAQGENTTFEALIDHVAVTDRTNRRNYWRRRGDAIWVWRHTQYLLRSSVADGVALEEFIQFCEKHKISEVYLYAGNMEYFTDEMFAATLETFHERGIRVEGLMGEGAWLMPTGGWDIVENGLAGAQDRSDAMQVMRDFLGYQSRHQDTPEAMFDGVHLDVEIQTLEKDDGEAWIDPVTYGPIDERMRIQYFLDLADGLQAERTAASLSADELPFNWDISMHYDQERHASLDWTVPGVGTRPAWQFIFDKLERITFMTYADRSHYISGGLEDELAYIESMEKPPIVRFGLEFQRRFKHHLLENIGFANEDHLSYLNLRQNLESVMGNKSYFLGWAMHSYDNAIPKDGDYRSWIQENPPVLERQLDLNVQGEAIQVPTSTPSASKEMVHLRLEITSAFTSTVATSGAEEVPLKRATILVPIGPGYVREADLQAGAFGYNGLVPETWWFYSELRWWRNDQGLGRDLLNRGLAWHQPPRQDSENALGVVRELTLEKGENYRIVVLHNREEITEYVSRSLRAQPLPDGTGSTRDNPLVMKINLGAMTNVTSSVEVEDTPHFNASFVVFDNDGDGLSDDDELIHGTNPLHADTDGDGIVDKRELDRGSDPSDPLSP